MDAAELAAGVRAGERRALSQAITLVESTLPEQQLQAEQLLGSVLKESGGSHRVAVTGLPGAGKSTLVDALGAAALERGRRVAVLAVDPASARSGGSLLGDSLRMSRLAASERAFIRSSSNAGMLGGAAPATRDAILLCEAAGFDLVLLETVGVGQAEQDARDLCDTLVCLTLAGGGDEIQGMKRGLWEVADAILVNKADDKSDGAGQQAGRACALDLEAALRLLRPDALPHVAAVSAATGGGVGELMTWLDQRAGHLVESGERARLRQGQLERAFDRAVARELQARLKVSGGVGPASWSEMRGQVGRCELLPSVAARSLVASVLGSR